VGTICGTHPWLSFQFDTKAFPPDLWLLLGEASSKCEHLAGVPLRPDTAAGLHVLYLAKGAQATTAIEGNTLSEAEVLARIERGERLPPSKEYLGVEIDNVVRACNDIGARILAGSPDRLRLSDLQEFNQRVLDGLPLREGIVPGAVRDHAIRVGGYIGPPFEQCAALLERLCDWLNGAFGSIAGSPLPSALLKAVVAHVYFVWIHPFSDGNGRTARLLEFRILLEGGVPTPAAHLLSNHYNQTRTEYYRHLDEASISGGDLMPFVRYALQGYVDLLREQVGRVREQQLDVTWQNYVQQRLQAEPPSPTRERQRQLILDLSASDAPATIAEIAGLTPTLAALYRQKTDKTITRDVNKLIALGLVERKGGKLRAKKELVAAFLPARRGR
jgi:Fic family protein